MFFLPGPKQAGVSLISALIGVSIVGIGTVAIFQTISTGFKGSKSVGIRQELDIIRQTIVSQLDCRATLNNPAALPLPCTNDGIALKRKDDSTIVSDGGRLGDWTINASCENNEIIVRATQAGKDPLSGKDRNSIFANASGVTISSDLFGGITDFCRPFFTSASATCSTAPYTLPQGFDSGGAVCCRLVSPGWGTPYGSAGIALCAANEYVKQGGAICSVGSAGGPAPNFPGFLHTSGFYLEPVTKKQGWIGDCFGHDWTADSASKAWAICCPVIQ